MSQSSIRIKARMRGEMAEVKILISHPMETGMRRNKQDGSLVPANFIKEVHCLHNGELVVKAHWGLAISKDPFLSFRINDAKVGDQIKISWEDNFGKRDSQEATVR